MKAIAAFLIRYDCYNVEIQGDTIYFVTPNSLSGKVVRHRGGALTETIDGDVTEFRNFTAMKLAWGPRS